MKRDDCLYKAFYCEENIWKLCQQPRFEDLESYVCVITNKAQCCAFLAQRASVTEKGFLTWDYHVILLAKERKNWLVYDLDTQLAFPISLEVYLDRSFPSIFPAEYRPLFRLVCPRRFRTEFRSDRSHMLNDNGDYAAPIPSWEPPGQGEGPTNFADLIDPVNPEWGKLYNLSSLRQTLIG